MNQNTDVPDIKHHPKYWQYHKEEFNKEITSLDLDVIQRITADTSCEEHDLLLQRVEQLVAERIKKN